MSAFSQTSISRAKRVRPVVVLLLVLLAFSLPPGCVTTKVYEGPDLPREDISIVSTTGFNYYVFVMKSLEITSVDGTRTQLATKKVEVLPGSHSFSLNYATSGCSRYTGVIAFDTAAGHEYEIWAEQPGGIWLGGILSIWAVDKNTGEIVAGVGPPE